MPHKSVTSRFILNIIYGLHGGFPGVSGVKNPHANAGATGDAVSIPESGKSSGGGHGNPLQYSCLENSMNR